MSVHMYGGGSATVPWLGMLLVSGAGAESLGPRGELHSRLLILRVQSFISVDRVTCLGLLSNAMTKKSATML